MLVFDTFVYYFWSLWAWLIPVHATAWRDHYVLSGMFTDSLALVRQVILGCVKWTEILAGGLTNTVYDCVCCYSPLRVRFHQTRCQQRQRYHITSSCSSTKNWLSGSDTFDSWSDSRQLAALKTTLPTSVLVSSFIKCYSSVLFFSGYWMWFTAVKHIYCHTV